MGGKNKKKKVNKPFFIKRVKRKNSTLARKRGLLKYKNGHFIYLFLTLQTQEDPESA
jgi:hypothetical protein